MDSKKRHQRHRRIRSRVKGTSSRPRVSVFRSLRSITVQLVDDARGHTLVSVQGQIGGKQTKTQQAHKVGEEVAKKALASGISTVVLDRGGYRYHGRVRAVAEAMRKAGLTF